MRVGSVEITSLLDSVGELGELSKCYPDAPVEAWEPYAELYPEVCAEGRWRLPCASFLLRVEGRTILADTGTGPPGFFWEDEPEFQARLPAALAEHGVAPEDVDLVFLTHTHGDHIGWNADAAGEPTFPRARYLMHRGAVARALERSDEEHIDRAFKPLFERGLVDEIEGGEEIASGVVTVPMPGHDPGHTGLRVSSDGATVLLIGDAVPHPALADRPNWDFRWDHDRLESKATRAMVLAELVDTEVLLACGHYPRSGIGRLRTREGRVVFESSD